MAMIAAKVQVGCLLLPRAFVTKRDKSQTAGFEPAHAEHTRLAGEPRNHLGTSASPRMAASPMV